MSYVTLHYDFPTGQPVLYRQEKFLPAAPARRQGAVSLLLRIILCSRFDHVSFAVYTRHARRHRAQKFILDGTQQVRSLFQRFVCAENRSYISARDQCMLSHVISACSAT